MVCKVTKIHLFHPIIQDFDHFSVFFNRDSVMENIVGGVQKFFWDTLAKKGMGISWIAGKFLKKVFLTHPNATALQHHRKL